MESYQPSHQPQLPSTSNSDHENLTSLYDDLDSFIQELSFDSPTSPVNTFPTNHFASSSQVHTQYTVYLPISWN